MVGWGAKADKGEGLSDLIREEKVGVRWAIVFCSALGDLSGGYNIMGSS